MLSLWFSWLGLAAAASLAVFLFLNRGFYFFFGRERGALFALRVLPFHLLYYLYSGVALAIGVGRHVGRRLASGRGRPKAGSAIP